MTNIIQTKLSNEFSWIKDEVLNFEYSFTEI